MIADNSSVNDICIKLFALLKLKQNHELGIIVIGSKLDSYLGQKSVINSYEQIFTS